jgi:Tol biopolymer transport system component
MLAQGARLKHYEILGPLGSGGMGEVYQARDTRLGRNIALKVLPEDVAQNAARQQRFEQEARTVASLNHPNIVALHDIGNDNGVVFIVTELVDGETLRGASYPLRKAIDIAAQVAEGLAAAHAVQITHRDLKPDNVMVTRDGRAKILDFGLADQRSQGASTGNTATVTGAGTVMGTVGYMSPEQVRGEQADHRSDIFSFGALLYELLSGERAFNGDTAVEAMTAILKKDPPELPDSVPAGLRDLVHHCLEKNPGHRFQSAKDLAFALRAVGGRSISASGLQPIVSSAPPRRRRLPLWAGAVLLLGGAFIGGVAALRWASSLDGGIDPIRLTRFASELAMEVDPAFSPDGKSVAYRRTGGTIAELVVQTFDSPTPVVLVSSVNANRPFWTADGARICYISQRSLWCVGASGGTPQRRLPDVVSALLTRDGNTVVFLRGDNNRLRLFTSSPPGSDPKAVETFEVPSGVDTLWAISPDSKRLLMGGVAAAGGGLWLADFPQGVARRIGASVDGGLQAAGFFPDSRHAAAVRLGLASGLGFHVLLMDTESERQRLVLPDTGAIISSAISPDGKRIMYSTGQPEWDIFEYSIDGRRIRPLVSSSLMDVAPIWSPSGDKFTHLSLGTGTSASVWTRNPDAAAATPVYGFSRSLGEIFYSPDGRRFAVIDIGTGAIETLPAGGGRAVRIYSPGEGLRPRSLCWSPDGEWLWFQEGPALRKVPSQGGPAITVRDSMGAWSLLACSPDGSLAWSEGDGLHLLSSDGKQDRLLLRQQGFGTVAQFGSEGKVLYVSRAGPNRRGLAVVDVLSGSIRRDVEFDLDPADTITDFSVHPDGKRVLLVVGGLRYDLWMVEGFAQPATGWKSWFRHWEIPPTPAAAPGQEAR